MAKLVYLHNYTSCVAVVYVWHWMSVTPQQHQQQPSGQATGIPGHNLLVFLRLHLVRSVVLENEIPHRCPATVEGTGTARCGGGLLSHYG